MTTWNLNPGDLTTRAAVSRQYGGSAQRGIEPSNRTPNVMIYTDPVQGHKHGYVFDGWSATDPQVFYYTGEGKAGDQVLKSGNRAIAEHVHDRRSLRVFETISEGYENTTKPQRYIGEFVVDPADPYRWETGPSTNGGPDRKILVFKLRALDAASAHDVSAAPEAVSESGSESGEGAETAAVLVNVEANVKDEFDRAAAVEGPARRREAALMRQFEAWLEGQGHKVSRWRIRIPGSRGSMVTDTFDETTSELWEIKAGAERETVRTAIGQLADYVRFLPPEVTTGIVLPRSPDADLVDLIRTTGHRLLVPDGQEFVEVLGDSAGS